MKLDKTTTRPNHRPQRAARASLLVAATAALAISLGAAPAEAGGDFRRGFKHELGRVFAHHVAAPLAFWPGHHIVYERHHYDHGRHYYRHGYRAHHGHWRPVHRDHHYHEGSRNPCRVEHRDQRDHERYARSRDRDREHRGKRVRYDY